MPFIDFPNVPIAPGVPDVRRSAIGIAATTGLIGLAEGVDQFGLLDRIIGPRWAVLEKNGNAAIEPDSVVRFSYRGEEKLATHPVESGGFSTYNKVALPYDIQMTIACNGQGQMTRPSIIGRLERLKASTDLFDIVTPDFAYLDVNMTSYDYRRQSSQGVSLLLIEMRFEEIRETARATTPPTQQPSGESNVTLGTVNPRPPLQVEPLEAGGFS